VKYDSVFLIKDKYLLYPQMAVYKVLWCTNKTFAINSFSQTFIDFD
jgi:hypothetical protein